MPSTPPRAPRRGRWVRRSSPAGRPRCDAWTISYNGTLIEQWNGTGWNAVPTASGLPSDYAEAGGFTWGGGSLSGVTGGPLFAVGGTDEGGSETVVLAQPSPWPAPVR
jgi:hypothetical protein